VTFKHGALEIHLPKVEKTKGKKIDSKEESGDAIQGAGMDSLRLANRLSVFVLWPLRSVLGRNRVLADHRLTSGSGEGSCQLSHPHQPGLDLVIGVAAVKSPLRACESGSDPGRERKREPGASGPHRPDQKG
jgi:hypothetical protein